MLSNNQSQCERLESTLQKAQEMFEQRAYLHHFEKCGVSASDMRESFMACEEQLACYQ